jgi:hypothetical protein
VGETERKRRFGKPRCKCKNKNKAVAKGIERNYKLTYLAQVRFQW